MRRAACLAAALAALAAGAIAPGPPHPLAGAAARLDGPTRRAILREEPAARLAALASLSDAPPPVLTRPYLGPAHARAAAILAAWMADAGLTDAVWVDAVGNVRGRVGGEDGHTLILGSHFDTVPDGGRFDGSLGLVTALAAVKAASRAAAANASLPWPPPGKALEVVAFADEEGARFGTAFLGSSALAGGLVGSGMLTSAVDRDGIALSDAIAAAAVSRAAGGAGHPLAAVAAPAWECIAAAPPAGRPAAVADAVAAAALPPSTRAVYVEAHMEQGGVLERRGGARTAAVSGIAAQARWIVEVTGRAGHAGTVPMGAARLDAGAAAAEAVGLIEKVCTQRAGGGGGGGGGRLTPAAVAWLLSTRPGAAAAARWPAAAARLAAALSPALPLPSPHSALVCTVGTMVFLPGAPNVIPGRAAFSVDVRDATSAGRDAAADAALASVGAACTSRGVTCAWTRTHVANEAVADAGLTDRLEAAAAAAGGLMAEVGGGDDDDDGPPVAPLLPRRLVSGAGHDAAALAPRLLWAMLFVRDRGGVSHSPAEDVREGDVAAAGAALWGVVEWWMEERGEGGK